MKIILNIEDDATIPNGKLVEMVVIEGNEIKQMRETAPCDFLPKERIKTLVTARLLELISKEIQDYVNSKF